MNGINKINSINNNVNFQAKLDISQIKGNRPKWEKVAEIFPSITSEYPKETFSLGFHKGNFLGALFGKRGRIAREEVGVNKLGYKKLVDLPEIAIAEKMKKLMEISMMRRKSANIANSMSATLGIDYFKDKKGFQKFWTTVNDAQKAKSDAMIANDRLLKDTFLYH